MVIAACVIAFITGQIGLGAALGKMLKPRAHTAIFEA